MGKKKQLKKLFIFKETALAKRRSKERTKKPDRITE